MDNFMALKKYIVPCSWQMYGHSHIEAESWDEAIEIAEDDGTSLPTDGDYVDGSFEIDHDIIEFEKEEEKERGEDIEEQEIIIPTWSK